MTSIQLSLLDTELAIARKILVEVGLLEEQLIRWMREMEKVDERIFWKLECAWIERHQKQISDYYSITMQPLLVNTTRRHIPLCACMDRTLLGTPELPVPPRWYRKYAKENLSHTLGFATSKLFPAPSRGIADPEQRPRAKSGMPEHIRMFRSDEHSLPDEKWFDQACQDKEDMARDFPHLYWLARELIFREDRSSQLEAMDDRLEFFQVPETPRPSAKTLARFADRLKEQDGSQLLAFARSYVQEFDRIGDGKRNIYCVLSVPALYRAAILPKFTRFLNHVFTLGGSVLSVAEALLQYPKLYAFTRDSPHTRGIMLLGRNNRLRAKYIVKKIVPPKFSPGTCCSTGGINERQLSPDIFPGCLWMIAAARDPEDVEWLLPICANLLKIEDVARFNRLVATLGEIASPEAIRGLARLRAKTRHSIMLNQLNAALAHAAARSGLTTVEAEELTAMTYDLDERHCRVAVLAQGITATLSLSGSGQGTLHYADSHGGLLSKLPAPIRSDAQSETALGHLRSDAKQLTADMVIHRQRLERSWLTGQSWTWSAFQQRWLAHPVLSWLARRQIWLAAGPDATLFTCMIGEDDLLYGPDGTRLPLPDAGLLLTLWHPLHANAQDVTGPSCVTQWRQRLKALNIAQPIRQAWRETYTLTQEERESSPASYRYARRILNHAQVVEIGRRRGWRMRSLSPHISSSESAPWSFSIPAYGLHADWRTGGVGSAPLPHGAATFTHVMTDRLRFAPLKDGGNWLYDGGRKLKEMKKPVRLGDVPPIVFSEIMRDLDLMISTSASDVAFDPETISAIPDLGAW